MTIDPTNWVSIFAIFYFLLPGLLVDWYSKRYKKSTPETVLREIGRVVLGSILISGISVTVLSLIHYLIPGRLLDIRGFLLNPKAYFFFNYRIVIFTLVLQTVIMLSLVYVYARFWVSYNDPRLSHDQQWDLLFQNNAIKSPKNGNSVFTRILEWAAKFNKNLALGLYKGSQTKKLTYQKPVALVTLKSGKEFVGFVDMYTVEDSMTDREILMRPVENERMHFLLPPFRTVAELDSSWTRLSIPINSIEYIKVVYWEFYTKDDEMVFS